METNEVNPLQPFLAALAATGGAERLNTVPGAILAWELLAAKLSPLIGEAGFCALYSRALKISPAGQAWPAAVLGANSIAVLLATLRERLEGDAGTLAANAALLETFIKLLAGLIGGALTTRLLNTAWAERPDGKST